ncbi:MAG: hypothetical protein MHPSP_000974 [Paramarteilia canceri]
MPEFQDVNSYTDTDYNQMMHYILNKLIINYQNKKITNASDKISILLDRKSFGWGEVNKVLDGFGDFINYVDKIYLIGPNRLYGMLSIIGMRPDWSSKIRRFSSLDHLCKTEQEIHISRIPNFMNGQLYHNWVEYFDREYQIVMFYLKNKKIVEDSKEIFELSKSLALIDAKNETALRETLEKLQSILLRLKVEIYDVIQDLIIKWYPTGNEPKAVAVIMEEQNKQLSWICSYNQKIDTFIKRRIASLNSKLMKIDSEKGLSNQAMLLIPKIERVQQEVIIKTAANIDIESMLSTLDFLTYAIKELNEGKEQFEKAYKTGKSEVFSKLQIKLNKFESDINTMQNKIVTSLLMISMNISKNQSSIEDQQPDYSEIGRKIKIYLETNEEIIDESLTRGLKIFYDNFSSKNEASNNASNLDAGKEIIA